MKPKGITIWIAIGVVLLFLSLTIQAQPSVWRVASLFMLSLIIATGLHLVTGVAKVISLCHVAFCGVGAYAAGKLSISSGMTPLLAVALGAAIAGTVALILAWITVSLEDHYLTLATLAASEILGNLFRSWTAVTGGANGLIGVPPLSFLNISLGTPSRYFAVCTLAAISAIILILRLENSVFGKSLRAVGDADIMVESFGLRRNVLRLFAFAIGGTLAGIAGAIGAHMDGFVGPESFGVAQSVSYLCFLVIGGLGQLRGVIVAGVFAVFATDILRGFQGWQMVILSTLVIFTLWWSSRSPSTFSKTDAASQVPE
ncbi:MAG TPA: branched-chain amino acid ABC transporter permease [Chthoniobacterales bacterium]|nr:branched-chain amino acid ABC transporter permease [Chthoniobacterales bacterium]